MRKPLKFILIPILVLSMTLFLILLKQQQVKQQQDLRQNAAGKTITAQPAEDLASKVSSLQPGDTLVLQDGTYSNQQLNASELKGTATTPITIQAAHDGKAIIDVGGSIDYAVKVQNSAYITIQGIVAQNAAQDVIRVTGNSDHITLRRITAHDTGTGNYHIFSIEGDSSVTVGPTNILVEDCATWGRGRYHFIAYHASNVTFRRVWARWTSMPYYPATDPRACFSSYGASNTIFENAICTNVIPDEANSIQYFTSVWSTSNGPANDNTQFLGSIFFDNWQGIWNNDSSGKNTQIRNSVFGNIKQQGQYTTDKQHGSAIWWDNSNPGTIENSTIVNSETGLSQNAATTTVTNTVFAGNGTAIDGRITESTNDFFQNGGGNGNASGDKQVDPGYDVKKYGTGAYFFVPANSPLKHAGANGSDIGANIIYESVNGQLTTTPLWPWPMEDRIQAEFGMSVTWESGGGFWKTLDGVYANRTVPAPTGSNPQPTTANPQQPAPMTSAIVASWNCLVPHEKVRRGKQAGIRKPLMKSVALHCPLAFLS